MLNWKGVEYLGIDVVPEIVQGNRTRFGMHRVQFLCQDIRRCNLPEADLYILKDVLQHWRGPEIRRFLTRMRGRQMLITNTVAYHSYQELESSGGYRPLDIRRPPFAVRAKELLRYAAGLGDWKTVLLTRG